MTNKELQFHSDEWNACIILQPTFASGSKRLVHDCTLQTHLDKYLTGIYVFPHRHDEKYLIAWHFIAMLKLSFLKL